MLDRIEIGSNLYLRPFQLLDVPAFFALVDREREHLRGFLTWVDQVQTLEDAEGTIKRAVEQNESGRGARFGIFDGDALIGAFNLFIMEPGYSAEFGTWLATGAVGRNIAHRAATAGIDYARTVLGLERIQFRLRPDNGRSEAFIRRLGFRREGREPRAEQHGDHWFDLDRYGLILVPRTNTRSTS
jgi:ribosomal-protein-serine acetyltransferase